MLKRRMMFLLSLFLLQSCQSEKLEKVSVKKVESYLNFLFENYELINSEIEEVGPNFKIKEIKIERGQGNDYIGLATFEKYPVVFEERKMKKVTTEKRGGNSNVVKSKIPLFSTKINFKLDVLSKTGDFVLNLTSEKNKIKIKQKSNLAFYFFEDQYGLTNELTYRVLPNELSYKKIMNFNNELDALYYLESIRSKFFNAVKSEPLLRKEAVDYLISSNLSAKNHPLFSSNERLDESFELINDSYVQGGLAESASDPDSVLQPTVTIKSKIDIFNCPAGSKWHLGSSSLEGGEAYYPSVEGCKYLVRGFSENPY